VGPATQRRELIRIGALLYDRRYVVAAEGNLSVRLGGDRFLITPSAACKGWLRMGDLLEVDEAGQSLATDRRTSSEWLLHREIYAADPDARAICHAHPPCATACAAAGRALAAGILTETAALLGDVPVAPPAEPGTDEVAASVRPLVAGCRAILLANHGVVTWGADLEAAYFLLESVERLAEVTLLAELAGGARPLPAELLRRLSNR
jgi:L-fuculose-phosphate aldolase